MKKALILTSFVLTAISVQAQFIKEKAINAQIGYGLSAPYDSADNIVDDGIFAQGEFILKAASWVEFRPYAGLIITSSDGKNLNGDPTIEKAETKAFLLGAKTRILAPIPWVAPYIEIGIGASIGKFETSTVFDQIDKSGIIEHIPLSIGLALGRNNNVDIGLTYYFQPAVEQVAGAVAVGVTFPLNSSN